MRTEILESKSDKEYIRNFDCHISGENVIYMNWDWPGSGVKINGAIVFETMDGEAAPEDLLARGGKIRRVPRDGVNFDGFGNCRHKELLTEKIIRFKIFPSWTEKETEYIYDQKSGNLSQLIYKRIILERRVVKDYKNILSGFALAKFEFKDISKLNDLPDDSLLYYKFDKKTKTTVCRYPAEIKRLKSSAYSIMIENEYDIDLQCAKKYGGAIIIKDFGRRG